MIVGTVKSVGGTEIDAEAGANVLTTGEGDDAQTTRTGLIKTMAPMTTGDGAGDGVAGVQDDPATMDMDEAIEHVQQVADRMFPIGKVVDSDDDTARLMIVTQYAGSKNAYVYNQGDSTENGTKAGYLTVDDNDDETTDTNATPLKSEGMFYAAGAAGSGEGALSEDDEVGATTKGVEVFSFSDASDAKKYVVLTGTASVPGGDTTYTYTHVDVEVTVAANGDAATFDTKVKAVIPEATDYEHIHFGAWAALNAAKADGSQTIDGLGIGFVQSIGDGLVRSRHAEQRHRQLCW